MRAGPAARPTRQPKMPDTPLRVLFLCVHNAGRSQMAAAFAREHGGGSIVAESAGTMPSERVHPVVVEAMLERGIDLSGAAPKLLTDEMANEADRAITMGCAIEDVCPAGLVETEDWALEDPSGKPIERVREIRDEIERRVRALLAEVGA